MVEIDATQNFRGSGVGSLQLDPEFDSSPEIHQPAETDRLQLLRAQNEEYLTDMWLKQDESLSESEIAERLQTLQQQTDISSRVINDIVTNNVELNFEQTMYVVTIYGEPGLITNGGHLASFHDCSTTTSQLTQLERSEGEISSYSDLHGGLTGAEIDELGKSLPEYAKYLKSSDFSGDFLEDLNNHKSESDRHKMLLAMRSLDYTPLSTETDSYSLGHIDETIQVGDVIYIQDPLMKEPFNTPSYHAMKVVGQNNDGQFVVMQIDAANPMGAELMTLEEIRETIIDPESRLDIYRRTDSQTP
jgi:hypothetical protein